MWHLIKATLKAAATHLFRESLLPARDDEEIVEEDEVHLGRFARVEQRERSLHENLAARRHDQSLARLLRQCRLRKQNNGYLGC